MRFLVIISLIGCWGVGASGQEALAEAAWETIPAADGLPGWKVLGGEWNVEDGAIVGRLRKTPEQKTHQVNCWLLWEPKEFADCEIEYEFCTPSPTNGGLQFRTHWLPLTPLEKGVNVDDAKKDAHGYQANIETRHRNGTGRLIDENGRGMLAEPAMEAAKTLSQRGWNRMRVVARGPVIEIYLHDVLASRVEDEAYLKGYMMLQVRADEMADEVTEVQYRNIRVKDYGREGTWRPLFNGTSLEGWKEWGSEAWSVENGAIIGRSGPKKSEGYLGTVEEWEDFHVRGSCKMLGEGNFGLFYHSSITLKDDGYPVISGVQGEVEPGYPSKTGWLYESYGRGWLVQPDPNTPGAMALRRGEWNELEIRSKAKHVTTWVNGVRTLDFDDSESKLLKGFFALQFHTGGVDGIAWKNLYVKE